MATKKVACGHIGIVWAKLLGTWDAYATGTYNSWEFDLGQVDGYWYVHPTAGIPGGGTDDWYFLDMSARSAYKSPLQYPLGSPGWTSILQNVYPGTLPDSSDCVGAYDAGPATARKQMWTQWCGPGPQGSGHLQSGGDEGVLAHCWRATYSYGVVMVVDQHGLLVGTPTVDEWDSPPTNMRGDSSISVAGGGGGGSVDLTPIVGPLQDIALRDVSYSYNNGATIFNARGKVNV